MKKVLNIVLLFILGLGLISCDRMLKDPLVAGSGFGDVILNEANVTFADSITSSALNFTKAEVKIDGKTGTTGVAFKNIKSGSQTMTITVPSADGKKVYSGSGTVAIKANEQITASVILNTEKNATNAYKFIFDPTAYGVTVTGEVHLVGDMNGWSPANLSYPLVEQADGTWVGYFDMSNVSPVGGGNDSLIDFKFMYDSTSWNDGHDIGNSGSNFQVVELNGVIESVMAWRFTFDPTVYSVTVTSEVHLVGDMNGWSPANLSYPLVEQADGTWVGYFDMSNISPVGGGNDSLIDFKFMYDSISWNDGHDIGNSGSNFQVVELVNVITQNF